jgi:sec-independent protein translocase protein TatA
VTIAQIALLGLPELMIILVIIVLIFGATRLSGLGRGLGQSIRGFKEEVKDLPAEDETDGEKKRKQDRT